MWLLLRNPDESWVVCRSQRVASCDNIYFSFRDLKQAGYGRCLYFEPNISEVTEPIVMKVGMVIEVAKLHQVTIRIFRCGTPTRLGTVGARYFEANISDVPEPFVVKISMVIDAETLHLVMACNVRCGTTIGR